MPEHQDLCGDHTCAPWGEHLRAGYQPMDGEDEAFGYWENGSMTAGARKTAPQSRILSYCELATDTPETTCCRESREKLRNPDGVLSFGGRWLRDPLRARGNSRSLRLPRGTMAWACVPVLFCHEHCVVAALVVWDSHVSEHTDYRKAQFRPVVLLGLCHWFVSQHRSRRLRVDYCKELIFCVGQYGMLYCRPRRRHFSNEEGRRVAVAPTQESIRTFNECRKPRFGLPPASPADVPARRRARVANCRR